MESICRLICLTGAHIGMLFTDTVNSGPFSKLWIPLMVFVTVREDELSERSLEVFSKRLSTRRTDEDCSRLWDCTTQNFGCVAQLAERRSLAGELTLSCARPSADG